MGIKFANFARSQLAVGLSAVDTTLSVKGTHGARFPTLGVGDYFYATLENAVGQREIIKVTARVADTFTVVRGQDDTTAATWVVDDSINLRFNKLAITDSLGNSVQRTSATGSAVLPSGTTAQQDVAPAEGYLRLNTTLARLELYLTAAWRKIYTSADPVALTNTAATWTARQRTDEVTDNDGSFDLDAAQDFNCTPTAPFTLTFTNIPATPAVQKGTVVLVNTGGHAVSAHANTKVGASMLAAITVAGTYQLAYRTSNGVVYVTASGALA